MILLYILCQKSPDVNILRFNIDKFAGNFFSIGDRDNAVDYAVGSPNGDSSGNFGGIVYLCPNCFKEKSDFEPIYSNYELILHGYQFGERFGHVVLSIDLDGDKDDDLVIGAPLHATKAHNYKASIPL